MAADSVEPVAATVSTDDEPQQLTSETIREWLLAHHYRKQLKLLDQFQHELRYPTNNSDDDTDPRWTMVHKCLNLIRHFVGSIDWDSAAQLLSLLKGILKELQSAMGTTEPALANIVRRVMAAVREEAQREAAQEESTNNINNSSAIATTDASRLSLQSMLWALPQHVKSSRRSVQQHAFTVHERQESLASEVGGTDDDASTVYPALYYQRAPTNLKQTILEAIQEILGDLEDIYRNINEQVTHHIHAGEVLLTTGSSRSKTITSFLETAVSKHSNLTIIIVRNGAAATTDPQQELYEQRLRSKHQQHVTIMYMELSSVFCIMPRVHKILLPAHAVLANGGLVCGTSGANLIGMAASHYSVPVIVVAASYKLCPVFPHQGQDTLQEWIQPHFVKEKDIPEGVETMQPLRDYIEPKYISLYITNVGAFRPSFIYRLLAEQYHSDDWEI